MHGNNAEVDVPPGLEQEEFDHEQEALAAVLDRDTPGKYTKVMGAAACRLTSDIFLTAP